MHNLVKALLLFLVALYFPLYCQAETGSPLDPEAMQTLEEAISFLEGMESFEVEATAIFDVVQENGHRLQFEKKSHLFQKRPDKLYTERFLDNGEIRKLWYDGQKVTILDVGKKSYAQFRAPDTIDGMLDMLENLFREPYPLADLLYSDLNFLLGLPEEATYVGSSTVSGVLCEHLAFSNENIDWQVWVEQGDAPFIRKVVITYLKQPGIPQFVSYLHQWHTPANLKEGLFSFKQPKDAERLSILIPPAIRADKGGDQ